MSELAERRRDRELPRIISCFLAPALGQERLSEPVTSYKNGLQLLWACADNPLVARLETSQMVSLYSALRLAWQSLHMLVVETPIIAQTQLSAGGRGAGGLVERWAKPADVRFNKNRYDVEVDRLADFFEATLDGLLVLDDILHLRNTSDLASWCGPGELNPQQRDRITLHILASHQNPLQKGGQVPWR